MPDGRPRITARKVRARGIQDQLTKTVKLIGDGIRAGSQYQPLRLHVAQLATRAPRKDYAAQFGEVFKDFLDRWRYVRDPLGLETVVVSGPALWNLVWGAASPTGKGHGDCDDATVAIGAAARALGLPVRIVTMTSPGKLLPNHVYPEVNIPKLGWLAADPVAYPKHGIGYHPPAVMRRRWDLFGQPAREGAITMNGLNGLDGWEGYGLEDFGLAGTDGTEPARWGDELIEGFGEFADQYGILDGMGLLAEVEEDANGYARTPMLEVSLADFAYLQQYGVPYDGMLALGDDGSTYQWDGYGSFFKKIFKAGKKLVRKVGKVAKKVIKKLPGGKYLVKLHDKIHKMSMKMVKPLSKFVGKYASKLAPIAALVPGYGPAIAAALHASGKIAKMLNASGVFSKGGKLLDKKTGKPISGAKLAKVKGHMKKMAAKERAKRKRGVHGVDSPSWKGKIARIGARKLRRKARRLRRRAAMMTQPGAAPMGRRMVGPRPPQPSAGA